MSVPLDKLYHYIESISMEIFQSSVLIYRFTPDGSKNLSDLKALRPCSTWKDGIFSAQVFCNDQELLNHNFYETARQDYVKNKFLKDSPFLKICLESGFEPMNQKNFRTGHSIFKNALLLHSEKNSIEVDLYRADNFIPVYYWNHALIAKDWYRYAEHVTQKKSVQKIFLIYNRAWSGTREYRLKFADLLIEADLQNCCKMSISTHDPDANIHYTQHEFLNRNFMLKHSLEKHFSMSQAQSYLSAEFDLNDYESTDIEIILETVFDDQRWHLTEKSLRPIACGQPFILISTAGSLEYLKSYGFKTFDSIWNENYDKIKDPVERLNSIIRLMKEISCWPQAIREKKLQEAKYICDYNKKRFFSQQFSNLIISELKKNLEDGFQQLKQDFDPDYWVARWNFLLSHKSIYEFLKNTQVIHEPTLDQVNKTLDYLSSLKNK
jgi:hypothetical protein